MREYRLYERLGAHTNLIKPLGYLDFLKLLNNAKKVLTDSGGIQNEAYLLNVPCVTLRENTEWLETLEDDWNILVGSDQKMIVKMANEFKPKHKQRDIFGDGGASKKVIEIIDNST